MKPCFKITLKASSVPLECLTSQRVEALPFQDASFMCMYHSHYPALSLDVLVFDPSILQYKFTS